MELGELAEAVDQWRAAVRLRVPDLRLGVRAETPADTPAAGAYPLVLPPQASGAWRYWTAIGLLVLLPIALVGWMQRDRVMHCGGLPWAERIGPSASAS